jgi:hypothetical protein
MSHQDEDFIDDYDDNVKAYFTSLFKSRSRLWKEFKLLLSPLHFDENQEYADHTYSNSNKNDGIKSLFIKKQKEVLHEEEEEGWEVVVLNNPRNHDTIPSLGKNQLPSETTAETKDENNEQEEEIKVPSYHKISNRTASLSQNIDLVGEVREVIIHAPKKKTPASGE